MLVLLLLACTPEAPPPDTAAPSDTATDTSRRDTGDTGGRDTGDTGGFCADVPTLAYTNFGEGFLRENCQGCHASTAPDRYGAPEDATFDTVEEAWAWADRILARATGESPSMPPQGGVSDDDRTRLEWWLRCGAPGT